MKKNYDERHQSIINAIYKHALVLFITLICTNAIIYEVFGLQWAHGKLDDMLILVFVLMICAIEYICSEIYTANYGNHKFGFIAFGITGLTIIVLNAISLIENRSVFTMDNMLTKTAFGTIVGSMSVLVFIYSLFMRRRKTHE